MKCESNRLTIWLLADSLIDIRIFFVGLIQLAGVSSAGFKCSTQQKLVPTRKLKGSRMLKKLGAQV